MVPVRILGGWPKIEFKLRASTNILVSAQKLNLLNENYLLEGHKKFATGKKVDFCVCVCGTEGILFYQSIDLRLFWRNSIILYPFKLFQPGPK